MTYDQAVVKECRIIHSATQPSCFRNVTFISMPIHTARACLAALDYGVTMRPLVFVIPLEVADRRSAEQAAAPKFLEVKSALGGNM